jgi:hypothetical protein
MTPAFFPQGIRGAIINPAKLAETHTCVRREMEGPTLDLVFAGMQAEIWSPNGEARQHIEKLGLQHTSMSVGDIAVELDKPFHAYQAQMFGFRDLGPCKLQVPANASA